MPIPSVLRPNLRLRMVLALLLALALLAGCQDSATGPSTNGSTQTVVHGIGSAGKAATSPVATATEQPASFAEPPPDDLDGGKLIEETWDAYSMQSVRVGYARTTIAHVVEEGRELIRTCNFTRTSMHRAGQTVTQDMTLTSWDTQDGRLVRFETRMSAGSPSLRDGLPATESRATEMVAVGAVHDGQLGIDLTTLGRTQSQKIPWKPEWGGMFAPDLSLRGAPLKPGEMRTIRSLLPIFNVPGETHLEACDYETVELPSGKAKLLKVNSVVEIGPQKIESILWVSDRGQTLKSLVPSIGQEAFRTTKADALRRSAGKPFDLLLASTVPLAGKLPGATRTKRVVYRAHVKSGKIEGLFSECLSQQVKPIDDQTAEITVLAIRPDVVGTGAPTEWVGVPSAASGTRSVPATNPPTDADLAANNFIQSDDFQIAQMAAHVAPGQTDPWTLACALEKFVNETITKKTFSQAFATAAEVARSLEGDCTEHAVLLAALCRARKIPARVAFGLVYYPPEKGFAYHMWNEVWIADRWVPVDATLGLGGIGADHIKLGDSNLSGGSPLADLLSVIQVFGRLELEVLAAE